MFLLFVYAIMKIVIAKCFLCLMACEQYGLVDLSPHLSLRYSSDC